MPRKLSSVICPECGKPGFPRFKEVSNKLRNLNSGPYAYFVHKSKSDGTKQCYIDEIWKKKLKELSPSNILLKITALGFKAANILSKRERFLDSLQKKLETYSLDSKERDLVPRMLEEYKKVRLEPILDYFKMAAILHDAEVNNEEIPGKAILIDWLEKQLTSEDLSERFVKEQLKENPKFVSEYMKELKESNPLLAELMASIHKHEGPIRAQRKKELSKKLSEAAFGSDIRKGLIFE